MEPALRCPKCDYQRKQYDSNTHEGVCPQCGIAYHKWASSSVEDSDPKTEYRETIYSQRDSLSFRERIARAFFFVPDTIDSISFYGKCVILGVFAVWGWLFITGGIDWQSIGGSFLHNVILPFHEFGHVLFSPFGRFMAILGGSLFQVLMPLGLLLVFSLKYRDNFAASIMLWWSGQSFIDISPYIQDAPYRSIPLIAGMGEEAHDWGNLLTMTNSLDKADALANISFFIGGSLIILGILWGGLLLMKMRKNALKNA